MPLHRVKTPPAMAPMIPTGLALGSVPSPATAAAAPTFADLARAYLEEYELHRYRTLATARPRVAHLRSFFGDAPAHALTGDAVRRYQLYRRGQGAEAATINRETSALSRMVRLAIGCGRLDRMPVFPTRLQENPPRQGFFEHAEYLQVRAELPAAFQDVLDFAYYSGWRRNEILELTWADVDLAGGVIRLTPERSKTRLGRVLPVSVPLARVLARRAAVRRAGDARVFRRDGVTVRAWRSALRDACRRAGVPQRLLHDCRRTAARNLIRAGVPERVAMVLTGHKTRAVFDRYNIVNERELATAAQRLVVYLDPGGADPTPDTKRRRVARGHQPPRIER